MNFKFTLRPRLSLLLILPAILFFLFFIWTTVIYIKCPVIELKGRIQYVPNQSTRSRTIGLKAPKILSNIPASLRAAVVYFEDGNFHHHNGFSLREMFFAIRDSLTSGRRLRGASTISQQLMKNIYFSGERAIGRKLKEAIYTLKLEQNFSKDEILSLYISNIPWGKNVFGALEASYQYFQKDLQSLRPLEICFLAAIIPNPIRYSYSFHRHRFSLFMARRIKSCLAFLHSKDLLSNLEEELESISLYFQPENPLEKTGQ